MSATAVPGTTSTTRHRSRRSLRQATIGNVLEWYDWNTYAIFAPYFAPQVFDAEDSAGAVIQSLMVFAVGFLTRPVGGLLLGRWADRHGRRSALTLSMVLMAVGSLLIAVCPTHHVAGLLAALTILLARLAQGLSAGGEFATAAAYVVEIAPRHRRGLYSSVIYIGNATGNLLAALLGVTLNACLSEEQMHTWGWRVPFLVGALLAVYAYVLRRTMTETQHTGEATKARRGGMRSLLREQPVMLLRIVGYTVAATVVFYTWTAFLPSYAPADGRVSETDALVATTVSQLLFIAVLPLVGTLADRVGTRPLLVTFAVAFAVLTPVLLHLAPRSFTTLVLVQSVGLVIFSGYGAIAPLVMSELFASHQRVTGIGFPYGLTVSLFGGTAPYLAAAATHAGNTLAYSGYVTILALISLLFFARHRPAHAIAAPDAAGS